MTLEPHNIAAGENDNNGETSFWHPLASYYFLTKQNNGQFLLHTKGVIIVTDEGQQFAATIQDPE